MASLLECRDCGHKVSMSATRCPSCGKHFGAGEKGVMYALAKQNAETKGEKFDGGGCLGSTILILTGLATALGALVQYTHQMF